MDFETKLPNNMMHFILTQFDNTMGKNGTRSVLNFSGLSRLIDNYPPRDFNPGEPIRTFFTLISSMLQIYGERGYRALLRGVGSKTFDAMKEAFPWLFEVESVSLNDLSPAERFGVVYESYVEKSSKIFDSRGHLDIGLNRIVDTAPECIWCIGLTAKNPICIFTEDFYSAMARSVGLTDFQIVEKECRATGHDACVFVSTFS